MDFNLISNIENCYIDIPSLSYYSHIPTVIMAVMVAFWVFLKGKKENSLASKILLLATLFFALWSFLDLSLWISTDSRQIMFYWSFINLTEMMVSAGTLYFSYAFLEKKDAPFKHKAIAVGSLLSFAFFTATFFNISGFDGVNCEADQGILTIYYYLLEGFFILWLLAYLTKKVITAKAAEIKFVATFAVGAICFSASFSGANLIGSLTENWELVQYGLFGMPVFMAFLGYLIVKYQAFNIKLFATEALVAAMILLMSSQFFFIQNRINMILTAITLVIVAIFGRYLIKSVRDEAKRREEAEFAAARERELRRNAEELTDKLRHLNQAKTQFLLSTQHHLRSPLTVIQGYLSLINDGTYGEISATVKEKIAVSIDSAQKLINLVNEMLDVANFQMNKGSVAKQASDIVAIIGEIVEDLKKNAQAKNIELRLFKLATQFPLVEIDVRGVKEAIYNIVDNAIKYTQQGNVTVIIALVQGRIRISVVDTGIGMDYHDRRNLFNRTFERGSKAKEVNAMGKGIGLYLAGQMIINNNGTIRAESAGRGKGTTFIVEFSIVPPAAAPNDIPIPKPPRRSI